MDNEEKIKQIVEELIQQNHWADDEVQSALIEVARNHIWKKGLWARLKFIINIVGFIGVVSGAIMAVLTLFGLDIVRRS